MYLRTRPRAHEIDKLVRLSSAPSRRKRPQGSWVTLMRHWSTMLLGALLLVFMASLSNIEAVLNAIDESRPKKLAFVGAESSLIGAAAAAAAAASGAKGAASSYAEGDVALPSSSLRDTDGSIDVGAAANADTDFTRAQPTVDNVHKVAGLTCAKHGGPPDELAAEMVYWKDIPEDASYVSPYREYGPAKKYLTFEPDEAGFNNIRMAMETAVAMALAMGRTLVMPPKQRMHMLDMNDQHSRNTLSFEDFYHFDSIAAEHAGVEVISTEDFLESEIMSGKIRHPKTGDIMRPPQNKTDWRGIGSYHSETFQELAGFLRQAGISSTWDYNECIVAFPQKAGPGTSIEMEEIFQDILKDGNDATSRERSYDGNPTPVDALPRDRMREMLANRHELCVYNDTLQRAPVFHFPGGGKYRLIIHFYAFMFFEDYKQDLWTKRFIRDHLRYVDEIQCAAARVVAAVREKARRHGNPEGLFDTFHIRRGDIQYVYKGLFIEAQQILDNVRDLLEEGGTIFIATDEKNMTYFDPLRKHYHLYFLADFLDEVGTINKNFYGMIDQRIASRGRKFFGTYASTFTGFITRMRGYHSQLESEAYVRTGDTQSYYFVPKQLQDAVCHYKGLHEPLWAREFPVSWRDIDRPMK